MKRYLKAAIEADLREKMVFLGGPRQVGKTTLALSLLRDGSEAHPAYLNWDDVSARKLLLQGALPPDEGLIILDEVHKYKGWRNLVKGFYDMNKSRKRFLVTGSAKLDHYRRGGDSLQGRYHYHRLHPFSLYELNSAPSRSDLEQLLQFGGFPEPFLKANSRHWKRWQRERRSRVIQDDLMSLEQIKEVSQLDLLASVLPDRVGSPLSVNNLRQDLSVAFETADRWITILENLYFCFRIQPYGLPNTRNGCIPNAFGLSCLLSPGLEMMFCRIPNTDFNRLLSLFDEVIGDIKTERIVAAPVLTDLRSVDVDRGFIVGSAKMQLDEVPRPIFR